MNVGIASDCGGHYLLEKAVGPSSGKGTDVYRPSVTAQEGRSWAS